MPAEFWRVLTRRGRSGKNAESTFSAFFSIVRVRTRQNEVGTSFQCDNFGSPITGRFSSFQTSIDFCNPLEPLKILVKFDTEFDESFISHDVI